MDNAARITKVETFVETIREELDRLRTAMADLHKDHTQLRDHVDKGFKEQRDYVDKGFKEQRDYVDKGFKEQRDYVDKALAEQREYVDQGLKDLRAYVDHGFEQARKQADINQRWVIGICLGNTALIVGLYGRMFGLY